MKKISLKNLNLKEVEKLSREQLKNALGGWTGWTSQGTEIGTEDPCDCNSDDDCSMDGTIKCHNCDSGGKNGRFWGYCTSETTH